MTDQAPDNNSDEKKSSRLAVFRHPGFGLFIFGRMIGVFGNQLIHVGVGWLVYDRTEDALNLAFVGLAQFVPALAFALVTGHVADRYNRKLVMASTYVLQASGAAMIIAYLVFEVSVIWPLFVILFLLGTARTFYQPAGQALLPNLVPDKDLAPAIAWNTSSNKFATVVGPAIGGLLYLLGPEVTFGAALVTYALAGCMVMMIPLKPRIAVREPLSWGSLVAGFSYMRIKPVVFGAISMDMFAVLFGGLNALLPIYARDILDTGPEGLGLLRSSPAIGAVLAGLVLTQLPPMRRAGVVLYTSVGIFGLATLTFAFSEIFILSMLALVVLGAADLVSVYIRVTVMQLATPDHMRGRVNAVNGIFVSTSNELGEFRAGVMAAAFGAVASAAVGGVVILAVTALWWKLFPELARADRLDDKQV